MIQSVVLVQPRNRAARRGNRLRIEIEVLSNRRAVREEVGRPRTDNDNRNCAHITKEHSMERLERITQDPGVMGGRACIRGMRVTVGMIVSQIGAGHTVDEILADYPYLEREDVMQALRYAAWRAEEREVVLARA